MIQRKRFAGFTFRPGRAAVCLLFAVLILASGCHSPRFSKEPVFERWRDIKEKTTAALDRIASGDLRRQDVVDTETVVFEDEQISLEGSLPTNVIDRLDIPRQTDVGLVLRALARVGDQNVLVSSGAEGKVDFTLTNVPWNEAFEGLLAATGLTYIWDGEVIKVMTLEEVKKDLELKRVRQEHMTLSAQIRSVQPLSTKVVKVRYADAMKLGENLKQILESSGIGEDLKARGSLTVDEDNNTIVIQAVPDEVAKISSLIQRLDRPKAQVLIEARIIETNNETARELGIQWGGLYSVIRNGRNYLLSPQAGDTVPGLSGRSAANFPADLSDGDGLTLGFVAERFGGGDLLNIQLTALQSDGRLDILSSPSITTLDNETATIESGEERAYVKTTGSGSSQTTSIEWKPALLKLEVTPHVIDRKRLKMEISAMKEEFDESKPPVENQYPKSTKKAETTVVLHDGETTVIGGLSKELESSSEQGVPFLKDIPLLGFIFKGIGKRQVNDEILIFITPYILGEDAVSL